MINDNHSALDPVALQRLRDRIAADIDRGLYDGAVINISRHGEVGLEEAIGYADRAQNRPAQREDVFRIFSMTKALTNVLVLQALDRGLLSLSTRVVDVIPEFWGKDRFRAAKKDKINIVQLLTHRAGLVTTPNPLPYAELGNLENVIAAICQMDVVGDPGATFNYSPTLNHALLGEIARRVTGAASYRELVQREIFGPLGMNDSAIGAPAGWDDRYVPVKGYLPDSGWLDNSDIEIMNDIIDEHAEMPWVGAVSTTPDMHRFAEMLRRGGELEGHRVLSPGILELATTNHTGDALNDLYAGIAMARGWEIPPGNYGLGFALSGTGTHPSFFGPATSPRTFGNYGAGSTLFWVDPERDMTFTCLTAGVMDEGDNVDRFQQLSTMAVACAL